MHMKQQTHGLDRCRNLEIFHIINSKKLYGDTIIHLKTIFHKISV